MKTFTVAAREPSGLIGMWKVDAETFEEAIARVAATFPYRVVLALVK